MAIDPEVLAKQRIGAVRRDGPCSRCGRRTRDKTGTCAACRTRTPDLRRLATSQVAGIMAACREELERRRSELESALKGGEAA